VLLHKGKAVPSIPVAFATHKQETYENIKEILNHVNGKIYQWRICCDLKFTAILMELRKGYTNFFYFL
jgi:hypothetical protein